MPDFLFELEQDSSRSRLNHSCGSLKKHVHRWCWRVVFLFPRLWPIKSIIFPWTRCTSFWTCLGPQHNQNILPPPKKKEKNAQTTTSIIIKTNSDSNQLAKWADWSFTSHLYKGLIDNFMDWGRMTRRRKKKTWHTCFAGCMAQKGWWSGKTCSSSLLTYAFVLVYFSFKQRRFSRYDSEVWLVTPQKDHTHGPDQPAALGLCCVIKRWHSRWPEKKIVFSPWHKCKMKRLWVRWRKRRQFRNHWSTLTEAACFSRHEFNRGRLLWYPVNSHA